MFTVRYRPHLCTAVLRLPSRHPPPMDMSGLNRLLGRSSDFDHLRRQHRVWMRYPGGESFLYSMTIAGCLLRHGRRTWGLALPCSSLSGTSTSGVLAVRDSNLWCTIVLRCFHRKVVCRQRPGSWSLSAATMAVARQTSTISGCEASMVRAGHAVSYRPLRIRYPRLCRAEA